MHRGLETIKLGWKEYMQQPVLPASLAYVLLYFNVVLAPGSLMTAFLTQRGTIQILCPTVVEYLLILIFERIFYVIFCSWIEAASTHMWNYNIWHMLRA